MPAWSTTRSAATSIFTVVESQQHQDPSHRPGEDDPRVKAGDRFVIRDAHKLLLKPVDGHLLATKQ